MIKRAYIFILLNVIVVGGIMGQSSALTFESYDYYNNGEYIKAAELIDMAVSETEDSTNTESWQLRAILYWKIYEGIDKKSVQSEARVKCLYSVLKSIEFDTSKAYFDQSVKLLDRLSNSYFNDAVYATTHLNINDLKFSENSYLEYKRIKKIAHPEMNFDEKDINFYKAESTSFARKYLEDVQNNKELFYLTIESLQKVLEIDSNNYNANYNTAIYYYNEGVYPVETIGAEVDLDQLFLIIDSSVDRFKESLPYMLKADKIKRREETLIGLRGIYNALNDLEKTEYYSRELEKWEKEHPDQ